MFQTLNEHYVRKFGAKVYKQSIDGGFTCPNRDGRVGRGGCIFCSASGSGDFAEKGNDILLQLERAKSKVESKYKGGKYIAYFQAFTNTYAPLKRLEELYLKALSPDYIVGLAIGTRPDCLPEKTVELLSKINKIKPVSVELGLQTLNEKTAERINRCYKNEVYFDAVKRLKAAGIEVVTHIMIGLPGENAEDAVNTTKGAVEAGTNGVKFHLLHVLRGTALEKEYLSGGFDCLSLQKYAEILKECIALLPYDVVVHRITGDGAKKDLVAPLWSADKKKVLNFLFDYLKD